MPTFSKGNSNELKEFIYNSHDHDAKLKTVKYDSAANSLKIGLYNPIFKVKIDLTFQNIGIAFTVKGEWVGSRDTIISLTVEEDFSYLQTYLQNCSKYIEDHLYLLFQMFSGDELHIVSKAVTVEISHSRTGDGSVS